MEAVEFSYLSEYFCDCLGQEPSINLRPSQMADILNDSQYVKSISQKLNYKFKQPIYLLKSLVHRSFAHEYQIMPLDHNEKLEFLGDSLLNTIVTVELMKRFESKLKEGDLSKLRGALVNEDQLFIFAKELKLERCILVGRGELKKEGMGRKSIMADAFEALIAAIYLDSNFDTVQKVMTDYFTNHHGDTFSADKLEEFDAKSRLQELTMAKFKLLPEYKAKEILKGKAIHFEVSLFLGDTLLTSIKSSSKKKAERGLAHQVLKEQLWKKYENKSGERLC